ncbi:hypothetical protein FOB63_000796 [Clavispora lusitaniae]|uniref:Uncharacterized protein n=1 Tax=Clavispora lusitaniae (strain ATCC 42720) TaxID=306902 RepID=C4XY23_CLAL4|nr:uncharacterized protein CLUG_00846 [Clavispora lusitaniae ATCC 42720]EEQ36723.1 hypothetical protein CLUG_00846 [Clavispora lusitaniae ATCC 42720]KAF7584724.1 hypothetical protein FOB63_000796 [Clavispora lusitaniae]
MPPLPPSSPISHKIVVGTIAVFAGVYAFWQTGKDFQFIKFEPRSEEEVERRKKEGLGLSIKQLETRTLDYTPEAKERIRRGLEEHEKELAKKREQDSK